MLIIQNMVSTYSRNRTNFKQKKRSESQIKSGEKLANSYMIDMEKIVVDEFRIYFSIN